MEIDSLEAILNELCDLARQKPLRNRNLDRAKRLMIELRTMGFTNKEVSYMAKGGWSEVTVKLYTRGTTVNNPGPKQNAIRLLTQLVDNGLTLSDVRHAVSMKTDLDSKSVDFEDVSTLLNEASRFNIPINDLLLTQRSLKASGLTIQQLLGVLYYKHELETTGFTLDNLKNVYQSSVLYGGLSNVLVAINAYASLKTIETIIQNRSLTEKDLTARIHELERQIQDAESELKKNQAEYAHLQTVIAMCDSLLNTHRFSVSAITGLYKIAKQYGEPIQVMNALDAYGHLKAIEREIANLSSRKHAMESSFKEKEKRTQNLDIELETSIVQISSLKENYETIRTNLDEAETNLREIEKRMINLKPLSTFTSLIYEPQSQLDPALLIKIALAFLESFTIQMESNPHLVSSPRYLKRPLEAIIQTLAREHRLATRRIN